MYSALSPHAVGVRVQTLAEAIEAAASAGFAGVEFNVSEVADLIDAHGAEHVRQLFSAAGLRPAGWGMPDWRSSEASWQKLLDEMPRLAAAAAAIGGTRTFTWILPASDELDLASNRRWHIERLAPITAVLAQHGVSFGLEFVGPKTAREGKRYPFIATLGGMLELAREVGPNAGLLLDCWHWYTSHGTLEEIQALRAEDVVYVHVNDAPAGIAVDAQIDNVRALPGETGVIDIAGFLDALRQIGYDGPLVAEPFKKELGELASDAERLALVRTGMDKILA